MMRDIIVVGVLGPKWVAAARVTATTGMELARRAHTSERLAKGL